MFEYSKWSNILNGRIFLKVEYLPTFSRHFLMRRGEKMERTAHSLVSSVRSCLQQQQHSNNISHVPTATAHIIYLIPGPVGRSRCVDLPEVDPQDLQVGAVV